MSVVNKISGVYSITNTINKRVYIGQSIRTMQRWSEHKRLLKNNSHHNHYLQEDYNKYGINSFEFIILEKCYIDQLGDREIYWINQHPNKYNIEEGGINYTKRSKETKTKISNSLIGNKCHTGHKHSEESKQKMSESSKGQVAWNKGLDKNDPRVQKNIANNPCFQKIRPPELVEAIRNGLRQKDMIAKFGHSINLYKTIKRELKEQGIPIKVNETTTSRKGFIMSDEQKKKISQTKSLRRCIL